MALHWDFSEIKDWQEKRKKDRRKTLDSLVWATLGIGMGQLNEKTAKEFLYRLNRVTNESGAITLYRGKPVIWTMEMLEPWFGMKTNVSSMSNAGFDQHLRKLSKRGDR